MEAHFQHEDNASEVSLCICFREKCNVICKKCGYMFYGRMRVRCPEHVRIWFLPDMNKCPKCKAIMYHMRELRENQ